MKGFCRQCRRYKITQSLFCPACNMKLQSLKPSSQPEVLAALALFQSLTFTLANSADLDYAQEDVALGGKKNGG